jgi:two-component system response regulator (stage 0 sporulation protein F)
MSNPRVVTVLYVDDEDINLFLFERSFRAHYQVLTANSGEQGLQKLEENASDIIVVISDMRMPGMDGITFIKKAKEKHANIAYFILTAFDYSEEINEALESKLINKFFTKPFDIEKIKSSIELALKQP